MEKKFRPFPSRALWALIAGCLGALSARGQNETVPVRLTILDSQTQSPVACRIHLKDSKGKPVLPPPQFPSWNDHFVCGGNAELALPRGDYSYEIERGPEYFAVRGNLSVAASPMTVTNHLRRLANLAAEGWWSGELHVHRPVADIELLMEAEDLHVAPVITWWNNSNLWAKQPLPREPLARFHGDRFYHLLAGEDERAGGALLFFNLQQPLAIAGAKREFPSPMKFLAEARQDSGAWVDLEKPFWNDAPIWLASGLIDSIGIANNHMQRSGMLANEAWGRARDKIRLPDPAGNGFWTQEIYYHALNCGLRIPPSAGSASGVLANPVGYNRAYVQLDGPLTYEQWWKNLRAGRVFVSNGPLLRCRANGQLPGAVFRAAAGREMKIGIEAALDSRDPIAALEIIKNGRVDQVVGMKAWNGRAALGEVSFNESGWFLVRARADVPHTFRFASTGPFYVEAGAAPRRVSKASAQFFVDWVRERMGRVELDDPGEREEVLRHHRAAERLWLEKVAQANAD